MTTPSWGAKPRIGIVAQISALLALAVAFPHCGSEEAAPNVVLIVVDTLRRDRLGSFGYTRNTSPNLDRLAHTSTRYTRWFSSSSWTTPSMGSLFTSLYPTRLQILNIQHRLPEQFVMLPEVLQRHGYRTYAIVSNTFVNTRWGFNRGWDHFDEELTANHRRSITSASVSRKAIEIVERHSDEPFFLFLHYFDPHSDYVPHADEGEMDIEAMAEAPYVGPLEDELGPKTLRKLAKRSALSPADLGFARDRYDREIAYTDLWIGKFLERLRELGLFDDALVIFTADHGEEFLDHEGFGHARTVYNELINVPTLIKFPGQRTGRVSDVFHGHVDLFPTILDVARAPVETGISGVSLVAEPTGGAPVFSETFRPTPIRAVMWRGFKLIHDVREDSYRLYDLERDLRETRDARPGNQNTFTVLRDALHTWSEREEALAAVPNPVEMTEAETKQLRALDYVE